jgi:hypothetical protein
MAKEMMKEEIENKPKPNTVWIQSRLFTFWGAKSGVWIANERLRRSAEKAEI